MTLKTHGSGLQLNRIDSTECVLRGELIYQVGKVPIVKRVCFSFPFFFFPLVTGTSGLSFSDSPGVAGPEDCPDPQIELLVLRARSPFTNCRASRAVVDEGAGSNGNISFESLGGVGRSLL
jgi:hypothetical protein